MDIAATSTSPTPSAAATSRNQIAGKFDDFLLLLTTQLENQDPLKPLDPSQFLGQLAQFSTVTGIQSMQSSLEALGATLGSGPLAHRVCDLRSPPPPRPLAAAAGLDRAAAAAGAGIQRRS